MLTSYCRVEIYIICALLIATVLFAYQKAPDNGYAYDDVGYLITNTIIHPGLTSGGLAWAFTSFHTGNWHPITWVSHMIDFGLYRAKPVGHHLTSVLIHLVNTLLVFAVLLILTNAPWRSVFVAVLFGAHPLHVESVAWISERKDLLSTLFGLLAILAYIAYVRKPKAAKYVLILLFFVLGLMSKPMLISLPIMLLLLDYWPLERTSRGLYSLVREKAPLLVLSAVSGVVTYIAQHATEAVVTLNSFPLTARLSNAMVSYVIYLRKMFWPNDLVAFYPHPIDGLPWWQVAVSVALLVTITALVIRLRTRKYLLTGWLWYLITALPIIGIVQVGGQALADRYTYIPLIGPFIMLTWGAADLVSGKRRLVAVVTGLAVLVTLPLVLLTRSQVGYWKSNITLFTHANKLTRDNWVAQYGLGFALGQRGDWRNALPHVREAVRIDPSNVESQVLLGLALIKLNKLDEAISHLNEAIAIDPQDAVAHANLADALSRQGNTEQAREEVNRALELEPSNPYARRLFKKIGK